MITGEIFTLSKAFYSLRVHSFSLEVFTGTHPHTRTHTYSGGGAVVIGEVEGMRGRTYSHGTT